MQYKIDEKLAQSILNYLGTRPYAEVFQLVMKLQQLEQIDEKKESKK